MSDTVLGILVGVAVGLLVLKFIKGAIKFVVLAVLVVVGLAMAHGGGVI